MFLGCTGSPKLLVSIFPTAKRGMGEAYRGREWVGDLPQLLLKLVPSQARLLSSRPWFLCYLSGEDKDITAGRQKPTGTRHLVPDLLFTCSQIEIPHSYCFS